MVLNEKNTGFHQDMLLILDEVGKKQHLDGNLQIYQMEYIQEFLVIFRYCLCGFENRMSKKITDGNH